MAISEGPRTLSAIKLNIFYKMIDDHMAYWADAPQKKRSLETLTEISKQSNAHTILFKKMQAWFDDKKNVEKPEQPKWVS